MPDTIVQTQPFCVFPNRSHGDLTIEWTGPEADRIEVIQRLMDKGVTFHKLEQTDKKKPIAVPLDNAAEAATQKVLIKDSDIAQIVDAGLGRIARFEGVVKTSGKLKKAAEVAATDTAAVKAATGG